MTKQPGKNPVIVLTAFGTSVPQARKAFDNIDQKARLRFVGYEIRWAFTSNVIRKKIKKQGIVTYSVQEALDLLKAEGYTKVAFQSLHVVPGQEYREIHAADTEGLTCTVGAALMTTDEDINQTIEAILKDYKPGMPNVLASHGNDRHPQYNRQLLRLAELVKQQGHHDMYVCSVEGEPGLDKLGTEIREAAAKAGSVHFIPLMVVAGDHIMNDVMGDEEDSWKKIIAAPKATCSQSLGYNDEILEIYFKHLDVALNTLLYPHKGRPVQHED